jgi:hypothetical protein
MPGIKPTGTTVKYPIAGDKSTTGTGGAVQNVWELMFNFGWNFDMIPTPGKR